jgi:hypothetical protein
MFLVITNDFSGPKVIFFLTILFVIGHVSAPGVSMRLLSASNNTYYHKVLNPHNLQNLCYGRHNF